MPRLGFLTKAVASTFAAALTMTASGAEAACIPNTYNATALQTLITNGGAGYRLTLCAGETYDLDTTLYFTAANQEISTEGYPTGTWRATLVVTGTQDLTDYTGMASAINGGCSACDYIAVKNVQINGNRGSGNGPILGNALVEIGGSNTGQIVDHVKLYDPRAWSCLHIAEGSFDCANATITNNDIGPCGSDASGEWADGVSLSCTNSLVANNVIQDATDGGIVIFGSPGSTVKNNYIYVTDRVMLGGINLVDYDPWGGDFAGVTVTSNTIVGGYAESYGNSTLGEINNSDTPVIKIGIAMGPRVWFGSEYGSDTNYGATITNNQLSGAFMFGMAMASVTEWTVSGNSFFGNTTFSGSYYGGCSSSLHAPTALLYETTTTLVAVNIDNRSSWATGNAGGLVCFATDEEEGQADWPYGSDAPLDTGSGSTAQGTVSVSSSSATSTSASSTSSASSSASSSSIASSSAASTTKASSSTAASSTSTSASSTSKASSTTTSKASTSSTAASSTKAASSTSSTKATSTSNPLGFLVPVVTSTVNQATTGASDTASCLTSVVGQLLSALTSTTSTKKTTSSSSSSSLLKALGLKKREPAGNSLTCGNLNIVWKRDDE